MGEPAEPRRTLLQRMLDFVERAGNKVPHPAVLFFGLIVGIVALSHALALADVSVTYERINPQTHETDVVTTPVRSLISVEGVRFIFTSVVPNFIQFGPVGIILVAMIGVGLAERSGLIGTLIRMIVMVAPQRAITAIIVTLGVMSSIATDAGYLVLIPLGAAAFHSLGRHPLAGLAAAFAAVAATFGVNFLIVPIDGVLAEMTNDAIHMVDPNKSIPITANFYFGIPSSLLLIVVCTLVTSRLIEPRLGSYQGEAPLEKSDGLTADEKRGLRFSLVAIIGVVAFLVSITAPAGSPLRHPETGSVFGPSPFMDSLIFLIMLVFGGAGIAYGIGARTLSSTNKVIEAITKTFSDLGGLLFLFFVISQFVAYFNYSNVGTILAVKLATALKDADLQSVSLLLGFLIIGFVLSIPIPNIIPKWAIIAPIFVPLFMKLGVAPDVVLAAYRVSDAPPNVINPLLPYFALVVGFAQKYDKTAGVGTIVAMMLPYTIATFLTWTVLFFIWYLLGIPFGPT